MRLFVCVFLGLLALASGLVPGMAFGAEVPPISAADFVEAANPAWVWIATAISFFGVIYITIRPYLLAWLKANGLDVAYTEAEAVGAAVIPVYTAGMQRANADGVVTKEEVDEVLAECKRALLLKSPDLIRKYGDHVIDGIIRLVMAKAGIPEAVQSALRPLPDLAPSAPSV